MNITITSSSAFPCMTCLFSICPVSQALDFAIQ